jgi:hypothetical protein
MRVPPVLAVLAALAPLTAGDVAAQAAAQRGPSPAAFLAPNLPAAFLTRPDATSALSWKHRLLTGLGSAALGAGMAFFASQINQSDWEEIPGQREVNRNLWAALGGGMGFAVGFSFPLTGSAPDRGMITRPEGRSVISFYEISQASVDNAYDIVRLLRPEWLNTRPPDELYETRFESTTVYLDDFRYGDITSLHTVHVSTIEEIRFVSAAMATARWGPGNTMGVIQIITIG